MKYADIGLVLFFVVVFAIPVLVATYIAGNVYAENKMANGTLQCEMVRDTKVCWNPKK